MVSTRKKTRIYAARTDRELADAILAEWWPDKRAREIAASVFARTIEVAHASAPGSWEVSLLPEGVLRLNVGPVAVLELRRNESGIARVYASEAVNPGRVRHVKTKYGRYTTIPGFQGRAWEVSFLDLPKLAKGFVRTHHELVERAARARTVTTWKDAHSPAPVAALAALIGVSALTPDYALADSGTQGESPPSEAPWDMEPPNPETERLAVAEATRRLAAEGWRVASRESEPGLGYDLHCTRGNEVRHVEVKGNMGAPRGFQMQRSQYVRAQEDQDFELFYVAELRSTSPLVARFRGEKVFEAFLAEPLTFALRPKKRWA